jgi:hypothetical protein
MSRRVMRLITGVNIPLGPVSGLLTRVPPEGHRDDVR